ncbi:aminotransferase class I/II-fold pyridoxal phosphate-dependent enzyme [Acidobacteria bacterium AH-259-O06]|nr:aminotransferase class I/II-fold pyridoxal phosphate-dependent enzyme [Acidobacteria bacterium AH-259-O06]
MKLDIKDICVVSDSTLRDALLQIDRCGTGFLVVVSTGGHLEGVITDGDIRRAVLRGIGLDTPIPEVMNERCFSLPVTATDVEISQAMNDRIAFIPLVDAGRRVVDYAALSRHRKFPVAEPVFHGNELNYVEECIRTGWISSQGRFVTLFERLFADFHGIDHALAVSNCTVALHLALISLGIGEGDEVIVPDFTFGASANAVVHANATPVLVDVDPVTWTMDLEEVKRAISPRTKAIMPVHIYGHACDMGPLMEIAERNGLYIIEDCAESVGGRYRGALLGTFGHAACFSFFGNKTITTGEGGMILFRDSAVMERARMLRDHGMPPNRRYWHAEPGYNYRLTNLQAAVGVAQMERIDQILGQKMAVFDAYQKALAGVSGVTLPSVGEWAEPVCWLYTVLIEPGHLSRDELSQRLLAKGVDSRPVFLPMHEMPAFKNARTVGDYPVTTHLAAHGLSLPSYVHLTTRDIHAITSSISDIISVRTMLMGATD